jgi:hypothetical protein
MKSAIRRAMALAMMLAMAAASHSLEAAVKNGHSIGPVSTTQANTRCPKKC